jgi:cysteine desulfurase/selenocysteine lyase
MIAECRTPPYAMLFNCPSPDHIVFTLNCSDALNLAIKGIAQVTSGNASSPRAIPEPMHIDHHGHGPQLRAAPAERPQAAEPVEAPRVEWTCVPADPATGLVDPADAPRRPPRKHGPRRGRARLQRLAAPSSPSRSFGKVCRDAGVPLLVDAAQSAGRLPIDVVSRRASICSPPRGTSTCMGPLGTGGLLAIRPGLESTPRRRSGTGGTGTVSPNWTCTRRPCPTATSRARTTRSASSVCQRGRRLARRSGASTRSGPTSGPSIERALRRARRHRPVPRPHAHRADQSPRSPRRRLFSVTHDALPPSGARERSSRSEFGVLTRAGIHCAPRAHANFANRRHRAAPPVSAWAPSPPHGGSRDRPRRPRRDLRPYCHGVVALRPVHSEPCCSHSTHRQATPCVAPRLRCSVDLLSPSSPTPAPGPVFSFLVRLSIPRQR